MTLNLYNSSEEFIRVYFYNSNQRIIINAFEQRSFIFDDEEIQFEISSNTKSEYAKLFRRTVFQVLSKYVLSNNLDYLNITVEKQEAEDYSFNRYVRFACQDDTPFTKIEYAVVDSEDIKKAERKNILLYYFMLFLSHVFSKINVMFVGIGIAIGGYFGAKYGIICYLIIFSIYFIISWLINLHNDKNLFVERLITHEYISSLFM